MELVSTSLSLTLIRATRSTTRGEPPASPARHGSFALISAMLATPLNGLRLYQTAAPGQRHARDCTRLGLNSTRHEQTPLGSHHTHQTQTDVTLCTSLFPTGRTRHTAMHCGSLTFLESFSSCHSCPRCKNLELQSGPRASYQLPKISKKEWARAGWTTQGTRNFYVMWPYATAATSCKTRKIFTVSHVQVQGTFEIGESLHMEPNQPTKKSRLE
jgi:hypothetical protein